MFNFITPENVRKTEVVESFQGLQKWNNDLKRSESKSAQKTLTL